MTLPELSIKRPVLVVMVFACCIVIGVISLLRLPIELYQGQNQAVVSIVVRARGGLPPDDVEKSITKPIEEAVANVAHLKTLRSSSREAESRVTMEFESGTDMKFAALEVREKFARVVPQLPKEIEKPVIANFDDAQAGVLTFTLTSDVLTPERLRALADSALKPSLSRVDGAASVEVFGGRERKILVELDRDKMFALRIPVQRIMDVLGESNVNLLAGSVDEGRFQYAVRTMGAFESVEEIGNIGIQATRQGSIVRLKDLATVEDGYMESRDDARLNRKKSVTVIVKKTSLANTIPVVRTARDVLRRFEDDQKGQVHAVVLTDRAEAVTRAIDEVKNTLYVGMLLTVALIYLFLRRWVLSIIVLISLPISVVTTFVFMDFFHISLNVMTLSGLSLAHGILVDSSIVILENVFVKKGAGLDDRRAIEEGAGEVWLPLLASLAATLIVFLPLLFIDKRIQAIYAGFALTVGASLVVAFFVAQTLVPVLLIKWARGRIGITESSSLAGEEDEGRRNFSEKLGKRVLSFYSVVLQGAIRWRYRVAAGCLIVALLSAVQLVRRDLDRPSTYEENEFSIVLFPPAGARLEANDAAVGKIETLLSRIPEVETYSSTIRQDDVRIFVRLVARNRRVYSKSEIMDVLATKGQEAARSVHESYGFVIDEGQSGDDQKKLEVEIFGPESDTLQKLAQTAAGAMGKIPRMSNVVMTDLRKRPEYALVVNRRRAAMFGFTVKDLADAVHALVRGMRPTKFHEQAKGEEIEVITRLKPEYRATLDDLRSIYIASDRAGDPVPLAAVADFQPTFGAQSIDRKNKYRYVFVKGDANGPLETAARALSGDLRRINWPDGYFWRFGGAYESLLEGKSQMGQAYVLTIFLVYLVMACLFESFLQPLLIMISIPMAAIGVWLALALTGKPLSETVFIGMILLAGYVVNAAIILVDHMNRLRERGLSLEEAVIQSGIDRLRPILMTTLSTSLGFLPMAMNWSQSSDLWSPLAVTVIGGLCSSTLLTLVMLPVFVLIADDARGRMAPVLRGDK